MELLNHIKASIIWQSMLPLYRLSCIFNMYVRSKTSTGFFFFLILMIGTFWPSPCGILLTLITISNYYCSTNPLWWISPCAVPRAEWKDRQLLSHLWNPPSKVTSSLFSLFVGEFEGFLRKGHFCEENCWFLLSCEWEYFKSCCIQFPGDERSCGDAVMMREKWQTTGR